MKKFLIIAILLTFITSCKTPKEVLNTKSKAPFVWENANLYFLLTDRFNNGDTTNDVNFGRTKKCDTERGYQGGDFRGIIQKIDEGYFSKLGTNVIWLTPIVEQIHGGLDEGWGYTYGFHGYWTKDWTAIDPNNGTKAEFKELVAKAHAKGIRIMLDAVINHTGPALDSDPAWPTEWVRTTPPCDFKNYKGNVTCTLAKNLPDVLTESNENVALPENLIQKWKKEGRYEKEMASLDAFFNRTGYPRAPKYYIIKWLTDYISEFGIDGYRCDTVKHTEAEIWFDFKKECNYAFDLWKNNNKNKVLDNNRFYSLAEVYGYAIDNDKIYDHGDKKVNYFENGFDALINFGFRWQSDKSYEELFAKNADKLNNELKNYSVLNYLTSHDDGNPFDGKREKTFEAGTKLLLSPGMSQTYYGDEISRSLLIEGAKGDATLRSFMNWNDIKTNVKVQATLLHYQKLGQFRNNHPAVGAGIHKQISFGKEYVFGRIYSKNDYKDIVVVGLDLPIGKKEISVENLFENGTKVKDAYSGKTVVVVDGKIYVDSEFGIVLLEKN